MRKVSFLIVLFFNILSLNSFSYEDGKRVLKQGKNLKRWISEETLDKIYRYLDKAGIDKDKLVENPYFFEVEEEGKFFLEIEGNFKDLRVRNRDFIEEYI